MVVLLSIVALAVGFLIGGGTFLSDVKQKLKKGLVPYLDDAGALAWRKAP